jgi:N-acylneuraminate cytidylyltransferase
MIGSRKVLAVITARGGSKGLPGKNVADVGGRPMVAWSVAAARNSAFIDRVVLSSDDEAIMTAAREAGCDVPFRRPPELATDAAPVDAALVHALENVGEDFHYLVLLQATSPLRRADDIDGCIALAEKTGAPVVSMAPCKPPQWMFHRDGEGRLVPVIAAENRTARRQDIAQAYLVNGAVYVIEVERFLNTRTFVDADTRGYIMPPERSVDVDTALDLLLVRAIVGSHSVLTKP